MTDYQATQYSLPFTSYRSPRTTQQGRELSNRSSQKSSLTKYEEFKSQIDSAVLLKHYKQLKVRDLRGNLISNYLSEAKQQTMEDSCDHYFPMKPIIIPKQESLESRRTMSKFPVQSMQVKLQEKFLNHSQRKSRTCFNNNNFNEIGHRNQSFKNQFANSVRANNCSPKRYILAQHDSNRSIDT